MECNGVEVTINFDSDGFPIVSIDTNGGFYTEKYRPTVEVNLNGVQIHDMFDEEDERWNQE
jgi:hypothetical protein